LKSWYTVIVDDTNFAPYHEDTLKEIAKKHEAEFIIKDFDTDVDTCIDRDVKRDNPVGKRVITDMYYRYVCPDVKPNDKWDVVIFDLDWTLASMSWRSPYDYTTVKTDLVVPQTKLMLDLLYNSWKKIILCSWRKAICREDTIEWLEENDIKYHELNMRDEWDDRNDAIVKMEMLDKIWKENVFAVFDDRQRVVRAWRKAWLFVFNVGSGREF